MDTKQLQEIKARADAATPGEWMVGGCPRWSRDGLKSVYKKIGPYDGQMCICSDATPNDADFIAHARTDIPLLVAEVEKLTTENSVLRSEGKAHIEKQAVLFNGNQELKLRIATLEKALEIAYAEANNAIYFSDSSDYLPGLYDVCKAIKPEIEPDDIGKVYIEVQEQEGKK